MPVLMLTGITFQLGFMYLVLYFLSKKKYSHDLAYSLTCLSICFYDLFAFFLYNSTTIEGGMAWQRLQLLSLCVLSTCLFWFVYFYTKSISRKLMYVFTVFSAVMFAVIAVDRSDLTMIAHDPRIKTVVFPWYVITYYEGNPGILVNFQMIIEIAVFVYCIAGIMKYYLVTQQKRALYLFAAMGILFLCILNDALVAIGAYSFIYLLEYSYTGLMLVMAFEMLKDYSKAYENEAAQQEKLRQQLFQSSKMASLGTLGAGIAHELNNVLAIISACSSMITSRIKERKVSVDEIVLDCVETTKNQTIRMRDIIKRIKDFSRDSSGEAAVDLDINSLLSDVMSLVRRQMSDLDVECKILRKEGLPAIRAVKDRLESVFQNLILNAMDSLEGITDREKTICIRCDLSGDGNSVVIEVEDNGCGIKAENLRRVFDPFFTTKVPGKGTGLGLSIIHDIISEMHGAIEVSSKEGVGTVFKVTLPAAAGGGGG